MRSNLGSAVALLASATLAVAGLTTSSASAGVVGKPERVVVKVDAKHVVSMPKTIRPGLTSFAVTTAFTGDVDLEVVVPDEGYTRSQFVADYNSTRLSAFRRLQDNVTFLGGTDAYKGFNGVLKVSVPEGGKVWAFDFFAPKQSLARVAVAKVTGLASSVDPVSGNGPVTAISASRWDEQVPATIPAAGDLRFDNRSGANTDLQLYKLKAGKTVDDYADWVADPAGVAFPLNLKWYTLTGVMSDGRTSAIRYDLKPGEYVVTSGWFDNDGQLLRSKGMFRGITLTDPSGRYADRAVQPARPASAAPFTRWAAAHRR